MQRPKSTYYLTTKDALKFLGCTPPTFRKIRDLLGIVPRRVPGEQGYRYAWLDLLKIGDILYPRQDLYAWSLAERVRKLMEFWEAQ